MKKRKYSRYLIYKLIVINKKINSSSAHIFPKNSKFVKSVGNTGGRASVLHPERPRSKPG